MRLLKVLVGVSEDVFGDGEIPIGRSCSYIVFFGGDVTSDMNRSVLSLVPSMPPMQRTTIINVLTFRCFHGKRRITAPAQLAIARPP